MGRRNWVVGIAINDTDDAIYGPYTERRARELAGQAERAFERVGRDDIISINAYPIQPYNVTEILDDFGETL